VLVVVKKNENDDEVVEEIVIDGACIRTPDEDLVWEETKHEIVDKMAKGKKPAPGKKK
jgi:hypothetical protein